MIIVMRPQAGESDIKRVADTIRKQGLREHISRGAECTIIGAVGDERVFDPAEIERLPQVEKAIRILHGWRIVSREARTQDSVLPIRGTAYGEGSLKTVGRAVSDVLPDTPAVLFDPFLIPANPYAAPAPDEKDAARTLAQHIRALHQNGRAAFVRIRDGRQLQTALDADADAVYLGGGLLENRRLLHEAGSLNLPVIVGKNPCRSVRDWLLAAEHIALRGNRHLMLCAAGSADSPYPDTAALAEAKRLSHLPVAADISRAAPHADKALLVRLAEAAGADAVFC